MRRRLDIAMSLIGNPSVIFLDEPTTGLDPEARVEVWQTIKKLAGGGTTILLTTQYLDEAEHLADRIAILHEGRIIVNGTLTELKQLLPPAKIEYVEKQPTLEDVFFALVGKTDTPSDLGRRLGPDQGPPDQGTRMSTTTTTSATPESCWAVRCGTSHAVRTPSSRPRSCRSLSCCCSSSCSAARSRRRRRRT